MSGAISVMKYSRVKSNVLAPVSRDPVLQHMNSWHLRHHELRVRSARPWEQAHVNPGRRRRTPDPLPPNVAHLNFSSFDGITKHFNNSRLTSSPSEPQRGGSKTRLTKSSQPIRWQAHAASHARQLAGQESHPPFHPHILETDVMSRLRQSRNYQQPRSRRTAGRQGTASAAGSGGSGEVVKPWLSPSSPSSSSGDSAYEAGGSSPPSHGSTPRQREPPDLSRASSQARLSSGPGSCSSEPAHHAAAKSPAAPLSLDSPHQVSQLEPAVASRKCSLEDEPFTPLGIKPLPRSEGLEYAMFEHELVSEIVSAGLLTNMAVKQACRTHMAAYRGRLQQDKMEEVIARLQGLLDVPSDDGHDTDCFGLGGGHNKRSSDLPLSHEDRWLTTNGAPGSSSELQGLSGVEGEDPLGVASTSQPCTSPRVPESSDVEDGYSSPSLLLEEHLTNITLPESIS